MFLTYLMFGVALSLSGVAAFYSIAGLTAIFAAAVVPIIIMGSILEVAKLVVTVWLHEYWTRVKFTMKAYLVPAVAVLMLLTSMGIFGFLSKAHVDQTLVSGDVTSKIALIDERIKIERENIDANRKIINQLDSQVDQILGRSSDERGAARSATLRRAQAKDREKVTQEILSSQEKIRQLNQERAPIAAEVRQAEAEVGPIKYIAAVIYGDNPDTNLLERAVRWVIMILVAVFDPLAVMMLLAAAESQQWVRQKREEKQEEKVVEQLEELVKKEAPKPAESDQLARIRELVAEFDGQEPLAKNFERKLDEGLWDFYEDEFEISHLRIPKPVTTTVETPAPTPVEEVEPLERPGDYINEEYDPKFRVISAVRFGKEFPPISRMPADPNSGDLFILTGSLPTKLYRFNGDEWLRVDKSEIDMYAYDYAYIDYLIEQISSGAYDPELLTDSERSQIETRLKQKT